MSSSLAALVIFTVVLTSKQLTALFLFFLCQAKHHVHITKILRLELLWWRNFAAAINGLCICKMGRVWTVLEICTDASFSWFCAVLRNMWLADTWARSVKTTGFSPNTYLKFVAACLPLLIFVPLLTGYKILVLCDNTKIVNFLKQGTTKNFDALAWLKLIFGSSLRHGFKVF